MTVTLDGETDEELGLDDFSIYRRDRPVNGHLGGGVLIAIRKTLDSECILKGSDAETIFCKINQKSRPPTIIACVYRPPDQNLET